MSESVSSHRLTGAWAVLARRYALALYELAEANHQVDAVATEMRQLKDFVKQTPDFNRVVTDRRVKRAQMMTMIQQIAKAAGASELTSKFLALLAKNLRLNLLSGIVDAYIAVLANARGEMTAEIFTAQPLSPDQEQRLTTELQKFSGKKIVLDIKSAPQLMGGLLIKLGSHQIDASLEGKLARLEKQLKAQREAA